MGRCVKIQSSSHERTSFATAVLIAAAVASPAAAGVMHVPGDVPNMEGALAEATASVLDAGTYRARWDGRDDGGQQTPSGVYFYRLEVAGKARSRKMLLLR